MQRVNQYEFYEFATVLNPLSEIHHTAKVAEVMWPVHRARVWVEYFLRNQVIPLVVCRPSGLRLIEAIGRLIPEDFPTTMPANPAEEIGYQSQFISDAKKEFETVLAAELQALDTYFISQKGIYATPDLIETADKALDQSVRETLNK